MVRFSCFNPHTPSPKSKKSVQTSIEAMQKVSNEPSYILGTKAPPKTRSLTSLFVKAQGDAQASDNGKDIISPLSVERCWKSEEISGKLKITSDKSMHQTTVLKKSQSLGSGLCHKGQVLSHEDDTDQGYSGDSDQSVLVGPDSSRDQVVSPTSHQQRAPQSDTVNEGSGLVNNESIFSIGDPQHSGKESPENSETLLSGRGANESGNHTPRAAQRMVKSYSLPEVVSSPVGFGRYLSQSRSCEDLQILDMRRKYISNHKGQKHVVQEGVEDDNMCKAEIKDYANSLNDVYDFCGYSALAKDWVIPVMYEVNLENNFHEDSSNQQLCDELPSKDFKSKRIEQWVNDLQHCSTLEETNELLGTDDPPKQSSSVLNDGWSAANVDEKATPGMEAAKRYISSLSASATTAQLSNYGLAVIPFLSAFVGLKVLNLSGNAIVKITAGTLPRGLHALNLSKNKISAIEGLRELTRLRVLDLSYNRILRIGHGLASCSSLKELYLAGNKISEVEGLHRLLKLTVLDLRFNKISTAKCLGQLAANYNSLQAISLEGNPAQKNVGDEQLKKHLLGLLPHLVYFNRQAIKVSSLKDSADRAVRLGINAHQFDRGVRSDNKTARKANRGASGPRPSSSLTHGRRNEAVVSPKRSKAKHVHFPPSGNKVSTNHQFEIGSKLNFRSELSMRRSRSEGTLGAL